MAESILRNQTTFTGLYGEDECPIEFSSNEVSTTIIHGLTATKVADKTCWVDGPLNYTITITNETDAEVTGGVMLDYLDPDIVAFNQAYGVFVNGTPTSQYSYAASTLSVTLPTIEAGSEATVSFRVMQV